jgi:hypothetical protein
MKKYSCIFKDVRNGIFINQSWGGGGIYINFFLKCTYMYTYTHSYPPPKKISHRKHEPYIKLASLVQQVLEKCKAQN